MPRREGSRVSGTGPEERRRLSDPHQIAVRAMYKNPPRTSSAPNTIKNILASHYTAATPVGSSADSLLRGEFTPLGQTSSPSPQPGRFFFAFAGRGKGWILLFKLMLFGPGRCHRAGKSGGPPLLKPSFKIQRDNAHNPKLPGWEMSRSLLNIAKRPLPRLTLRGVGLTSKDAVS
jgi:hypothetical protein